MDPVAASNMSEEAFVRSQEVVGQFNWIDYLVFCTMLLLSGGIGVFYGFFDKKKDTTKEFLMAGKSMTAFPIAMSLIASFLSAIGLLGIPAEVYRNGFLYYMSIFSYALVAPSTAYLYLPVFWNMQVTSAYEYLEVRFHPIVRKLGSILFILQMTLYMAVVVYAPALALSQVAGINLWLCVFGICSICTFYTTVGGMKAVLWTDTLQVIIMYAATIVFTIYGTIDVGGISFVWQKAVESGRADLINWDLNPLTRHTSWGLVFASYFNWIYIYGCNQAQVQRYLCVKDMRTARKAIYMNTIGQMLIALILCYFGLVIYAKYWDCDPVRSGLVTAGDQLFPLFVMDTMGQYRGVPGLFVAGIFSGALSTVSSGMNSLAAITVEDFVRAAYPKLSPRRATLLSKLFSLFYGVITLMLVFVAQNIGSVLSTCLIIFGIVGGPLVGMFSLGMFFPWANATGCFVGALASIVTVTWLAVGQHVAKAYGIIVVEPMATSVQGCTHAYSNQTVADVVAGHSPFWDFKAYEISYLWYSMIGCTIVIVVGLIVSFITGKQDVRTLNPKTLSPGFHWFKSIIPGIQGLGEDYVYKKQHPLVDDYNSPASILLK